MKAIFLLLFLTFIVTSCDFDQVESIYSDFYSAKSDGFFERGWIPSELIKTSMHDIYLRTNVDLNSCIFSYSLSEKDLEEIKLNLFLTNQKLENFHRLKTPSHWPESFSNYSHYSVPTENNIDSVIIAIDEEQNIIYGWRGRNSKSQTPHSS